MADERNSNSPSSPTSDSDMALVANPANSLLSSNAGINKRYRPTPAKTFQCRGYGECRMVFSRSEHLARHIRKHTGERPFTCHCGKQFSRLDNLRQHAQTVHADKLDQNDQMMRDLTSLHATMAAATKSTSTGPRGKRVTSAQQQQASSIHHEDHRIKQEEMANGDSFRGRPGTSTGYEGDHNGIIYQGGTNWHLPPSSDHAHRSALLNPHNGNHSFRDSSQSFRGPFASASPSSQSFLGLSHSFNFVPELASEQHGELGDSDGRRRSISGSAANSRPPTADASSRTLPPLAAVVSAALPAAAPGGPGHVLPIPGAFRRPSTATRPGTAPASSASYPPPYFGKSGGAGLGAGRTELLPPVPGYGGGLPAFDAEPADSPFSFHPPSITESPAAPHPLSSPPVVGNPRKRPYPGGDGEDDARPQSSSWRGRGEPAEYDYGSESRPQSRRLSVMELCNDTDADADAGARAVLSANAGPGAVPSRPTTSSGLLLSALALVDVDRAAASYDARIGSSGGLVRARAPPAAAGAASPGADGSRGGGQTPFGGRGVSPQFRRDAVSPVSAVSSPVSPVSPASANSSLSPVSPLIAPPAAVFSAFRGAHAPTGAASPSLSDASSASAHAFAHAHYRAGNRVSSPADGSAQLSRRGQGEPQHDQVRVAVGAPQSPVGMRV